MKSIGVLNESSLHATIKEYYKQPGDIVEADVNGLCIDVIRDDLLIEIHTSNYSSIRDKIVRLLSDHMVCLVYPIAVQRWLIKLNHHGQIVSRRKSPKCGNLYDIYSELVYIPEVIKHPNFIFDTLMVDDEIILSDDGRGSWRRKGWSVIDRRLLTIRTVYRLYLPDDYFKFIPDDIQLPFTRKDLAKKINIKGSISSKMVNCLRKIGIIDIVGKAGNAYLYTYDRSRYEKR